MKSNSILANARNRSSIGFALSVLFHIAILLFALEHQSTPPQETGTSMTAPLSIRLLPPSEGSSKAQATAAITVTPPTQKMTGKPKEKARKDQDVARKKPAPTPQEKVVTIKPQQVQPEAAAPTDMMSMLNNARERRRAAGTPDRNDRENQEQPDDNAIARANVQHSVKQAQSRGRNDGGGVFQITFKGVRMAEVVFRGWDERRRNDTRQVLEIDAGLNGDIDLAIVRKAIEVIRRTQSGDFPWQSSRYGRVVTLSARPQDDAELVDFLKKEFFEYYR